MRFMTISFLLRGWVLPAIASPVTLNETQQSSSDLIKRSQTIWGYTAANCPGSPNVAPSVVWNGVQQGCYRLTDSLGAPQPLLSLMVWSGGYCTFRIWSNSYTCSGAAQYFTDSNHDDILECVEWYDAPQLHAIQSFVAVCE